MKISLSIFVKTKLTNLLYILFFFSFVINLNKCFQNNPKIMLSDCIKKTFLPNLNHNFYCFFFSQSLFFLYTFCMIFNLVFQVHLKSQFIMNGVCVIWRGWIDLRRLDGIGCLEFDAGRAEVSLCDILSFLVISFLIFISTFITFKSQSL